jgi:hypothetical protein
VICTRKNMIAHWLSEPVCEPLPEGCIRVGGIGFPDVETLSHEEKRILRPVIERHPQYLLEILCEETIQ